MRNPVVILLVLASTTAHAGEDCYVMAADRFGVPVEVLRAIAHHESNETDGVEHRNRDGSLDFGRMQVNSSHLGELARYGIDKRALRDDTCINVLSGAWLLSRNVAALGWNW